MIPRPAETIQATIGSIIGAILILYGAFHNGFDFSKLSDPEVQGAITLLVSFVAAAVTWFVARRQRDPVANLASAPDGTVVSG